MCHQLPRDASVDLEATCVATPRDAPLIAPDTVRTRLLPRAPDPARRGLGGSSSAPREGSVHDLRHVCGAGGRSAVAIALPPPGMMHGGALELPLDDDTTSCGGAGGFDVARLLRATLKVALCLSSAALGLLLWNLEEGHFRTGHAPARVEYVPVQAAATPPPIPSAVAPIIVEPAEPTPTAEPSIEPRPKGEGAPTRVTRHHSRRRGDSANDPLDLGVR